MEAEQWVEKKRSDAALRVVEQALKDNPRHVGLLALQRRLEVERRQAQVRSAQAVLAESRPISLDFRDASLRTVLDVVSRNSGINFILDRDIRAEARVTVLIRQAKVEDALDLIVTTNQLAKKVLDAQTVVIYPNTADKQREYQEQVVRVFYLASADAKGAAAFLKSMLKIRDPYVDERSNMLSLRDSQENIQLAERLIALYDGAEPEVLMEVEVLEVGSTRLTELGVKFPDSFSLTPLPPAGATGLTLENIRNMGRDRVGVGISGLLVNLKREVGDFNTLANPRIRARNKEKAKILIGDKIPVITSTASNTGFVSESVSYLEVGIKLEVEPTVYADDDVAIRVALEVSSLGTAVKTNSGTLAYQIAPRSASPQLRQRDNQTQLLGGLITRDDRTTASRVPGVGDLPVLGRLFSSQLDNGQRTELVLAITPRIVRNIRHPDASETEVWVGTENQPKLRPVGGLRVSTASQADAPAPRVNSASPAGTSVAAAAPSVAEPKVVEPPPWPPPSFKLSGPLESQVEGVFEVKLAIDSRRPLRGLPVELSYPPDKLQLVEVIEGDFFRKDGAATSITKGSEADGRLRVGIMRTPPSGATGQGDVITLRFKATTAGSAAIAVTGAQGIGVGAAVPPATLPSPINVQIR
jgi:general secretion pathway protein D